MKQRPRIYYSASQRALIWDRWRKGEMRRFTRSPVYLIGITRRSTAFWLSPAGYARLSGTEQHRH